MSGRDRGGVKRAWRPTLSSALPFYDQCAYQQGLGASEGLAGSGRVYDYDHKHQHEHRDLT